MSCFVLYSECFIYLSGMVEVDSLCNISSDLHFINANVRLRALQMQENIFSRTIVFGIVLLRLPQGVHRLPTQHYLLSIFLNRFIRLCELPDVVKHFSMGIECFVLCCIRKDCPICIQIQMCYF